MIDNQPNEAPRYSDGLIKIEGRLYGVTILIEIQSPDGPLRHVFNVSSDHARYLANELHDAADLVLTPDQMAELARLENTARSHEP